MISAVLVNWKRPEELNKVIENLRTYDFIDDIVVWDNNVTINRQVWGRWLGALQCKHDIVYTQDDDCIIENLEEIYKTFDNTHLSNGLKPEAIRSYSDRNHTLVGWGAVFKKEWVSVFDKYLEKYGIDEILYTNADRIFTALIGKPYNTIEARVVDFPTATDPNVAMASQENFLKDTAEAMERIKNL